MTPEKAKEITLGLEDAAKEAATSILDAQTSLANALSKFGLTSFSPTGIARQVAGAEPEQLETAARTVAAVPAGQTQLANEITKAALDVAAAGSPTGAARAAGRLVTGETELPDVPDLPVLEATGQVLGGQTQLANTILQGLLSAAGLRGGAR